MLTWMTQENTLMLALWLQGLCTLLSARVRIKPGIKLGINFLATVAQVFRRHLEGHSKNIIGYLLLIIDIKYKLIYSYQLFLRDGIFSLLYFKITVVAIEK